MKVLVVDDSSIIRGRLLSMLSAFKGIDVMGISGDEDWRIIGGLRPDFIVLDIKLNKRNGLDILKRFKGKCPCVPVAMLSNYYDDYYINKCREFGADYFFDKSCDFDLLADAILNASE